MLDELSARIESAEVGWAKHIGDITFDLDNSPLPCGFRDLEQHKYLRTGKSDLVVVAARPGVGKTALALQVAKNVSQLNGPVLFFSLEMAKQSLKQRLYALESETSINKLHLLSDVKREKLRELFTSMPLYIDDTNSLGINLLMSRARDFHKRRKLSLIVVDYIQIVSTNEGRSKAEEVAEVATKLKTLAKDLGIPVLALAQMNRNIEGRAAYSKDPRPVMSDLADSAGVEKWSDCIMFLHRPYLIDRSRPGEVDVFVAKNRNGDTVDIKLGFSGELTKFFDFVETGL